MSNETFIWYNKLEISCTERNKSDVDKLALVRDENKQRTLLMVVMVMVKMVMVILKETLQERKT
jgi:hypothetical protein